MLKRFAPLLAVLVTFLLDTAILPVFYYGPYLVPLTLVIVLLTGIVLGRVQGMLYGMIAGLLLDVSAGTLGEKLFAYVIMGFLIGFFLDQQPQLDRGAPRRERAQLILVRAIWIGALLLVYELVLLVYQYFNTAVFQWIYVRDAVARIVLTTALCLIAQPALRALYLGGARPSGGGRFSREVKNF